jgi:hypothetical protein
VQRSDGGPTATRPPASKRLRDTAGVPHDRATQRQTPGRTTPPRPQHPPSPQKHNGSAPNTRSGPVSNEEPFTPPHAPASDQRHPHPPRQE